MYCLDKSANYMAVFVQYWNQNTATIFIHTDALTLPEVTSEPSSDGEESENDAEGLCIHTCKLSTTCDNQFD